MFSTSIVAPLSVEDVEAAASRATIYFAEDALRHGFIEGIVTPTMPTRDGFYLTDQYGCRIKHGAQGMTHSLRGRDISCETATFIPDVVGT